MIVKFIEDFKEALNNLLPAPLETINEEYFSPPEPTYSQAIMFIKTINDTKVWINEEYLDIFDIEVISYAVNIARKKLREGKIKERYRDWEQFSSSVKYMAVVEYLRNKRDRIV